MVGDVPPVDWDDPEFLFQARAAWDSLFSRRKVCAGSKNLGMLMGALESIQGMDGQSQILSKPHFTPVPIQGEGIHCLSHFSLSWCLLEEQLEQGGKS